MAAYSAFKRVAEIDQGVISNAMIQLGVDGLMDGLRAMVGAVTFAGNKTSLDRLPALGDG